MRARVALRHLGQRFPAAFVGDRDGDQVGRGDREVPLVHRPRPRGADVFHAQHADHLMAAPERHVQHRVDVERLEIRGQKLARAGIGAGVVGGNHALALDGVEIRRRRVACEHGAGLVEVVAAPVKSNADDAGLLVAEAPQTDAFHVERGRGLFQDAPQAFLERVVRIGVTGRQRRQRRALRGQALLAVFERPLRRQLLADVFDHRQHGRLVVPRDQPRRRARPEVLAVRLLQVQQHIVRAPGLLERSAQAFAMRQVGVVVRGRLPDCVGL